MKWMWRWMLGLVLACGLASAQTLKPEDVVPGEMLLWVKPGVTFQEVKTIAEQVDAEARPIRVTDTYLLRLKDLQASPAELFDRVQARIAQLSSHPQVRSIEPHWRVRLHDIPNDPLYNEQWALEMIKAPAAWDVEKGRAGIRIAIIDDNFLRNHPDLAGRYDPLSRNFVAEPPNDNLEPEGGFLSHGTMVMGVAAANTDNGVGIAGLCWEGVTVVALKTTASSFGGLDGQNILEAMQHVVSNASQIHVVNMSFGGPFPSPRMQSLIQQMYDRGIVPVAAAGNENSSSPDYPSDFPNVVRVAAVGPSGARASYSNYGNIDLAAPGGDLESDERDGVLTTTLGNGYEYTEGTSFASPYVAAAVALVLSAGVERHTAQDLEPKAVEILKETADPRGRPVPDLELGAGIINMEDALRGFGRVSVAIVEPKPGSIFDTLQIRMQVVLRRVLGNDLENITIRLNNDPVNPSVWGANAVIDPQRNTIRLDFLLNLPSEGRHTIEVHAIGQEASTATASVVVTVRAKVQPEGLAMFSTPYIITGTPEQVFGAEVVLARYLPAEGKYARYTSSSPDPRASFNPPNLAVRPDGTTTPTPPRGVGYFLRTSTPAFILGSELVDTTRSYLIPLEPGWNMIGNPFPFNVPWNACEVEVEGAGGTRERLNLQQAADREYIRLQIYRYIPLTGEYTWRTAPLGELIAWQAHWIRVLKPCTLVVPPVGSLRGRAESDDSPRVSATSSDGWLLRLIARSGDREDANNFVGVSARTRGQQVEEPPTFQSYVRLTILEPKTRSALAQDVRQGVKRVHRWELEVVTDKPNAEVTLHWQQELPVPRGTRLMLTDTVTGERLSMQSQSAYRFRTDEQSRRRFVLEAVPVRASQLRITDVAVTATRGNQFAVRYALSSPATVQVLVQDIAGRPIARLQTGNRSAGTNTVAWNGRTDEGIVVPPGTYHVQIIATSDEGETVRVVRPLVLTR